MADLVNPIDLVGPFANLFANANVSSSSLSSGTILLINQSLSARSAFIESPVNASSKVKPIPMW